jgi:receptor protein-tyrosine kinase
LEGGRNLNIHLNSVSGSRAFEYFQSFPRANWPINDADPLVRQEWSAIECLRTLYKRKATLAYVIGAAILASGLISLMQPRWYRSEASLEILGVNENFLNTRDVYPTLGSGADSSGITVQTQAEMLQEDALIEQVVKKLHLDARHDFQYSPGLADKFRRITSHGTPAGANTHYAADILKKSVKIVPSRSSRIIRIICDARDPQTAADLANALAQAFIGQTIETRQRVAQQTQAMLNLQVGELRDKLLKSEAKLLAAERSPGVMFGSGKKRTSSGYGSPISELTAYNTLKREVEADRRFYDSMVQRLNEAGIASTVRQSNINFVGSAQPATHPYKPNLPLNLTIGLFAGLILAVGGVVLQEQTSPVLRVPGEAGVYLTLPELGAIPEVTNPSFQLCSSVNLHAERAVIDARPSVLSESFRATLASILSIRPDGQAAHTLLVTSALPMEGKTTVVSNLAVGLAEIGNKVLLIDGDMRRPQLHKVFDQANSWGLSDILREKNAIEDLPLEVLVKRTPVQGVCLLPSGVCSDDIFGLLWSGRMARLLPRFSQQFDYVLVDAPPCLQFADARIMARYTDQIVLVVRANHTDRRAAQVAVQRLRLDGIALMGVILNRYDPARSDVYRYSFYYGLNRRGYA